MRKLLLCGAFVLCACTVSFAQTTSDCPAGFVCLTPAAARAALEAGDKAKALEAENKTLREQVIVALKDELANIRIQYAECKGESTILKQRAVSDAEMIALLSKLVRPKKIGLINLW